MRRSLSRCPNPNAGTQPIPGTFNRTFFTL
jgi:hypothetical protein